MLKDIHSKEFEAEIKRLGENGIPVIIKALKTCDHYDSIRAVWYCSLLQKYNRNLLKEICKIASDLPAVITKEFCWLFRSPIYAEDPKPVFEELEKCIGFSYSEPIPEDLYISNHYLPSALIELLTRCRYIDCAPYLEKILEYHLKLFDPLKKDYFSLSGEESLTASLSTALLFFINSGYSSRFSTNKLIELSAASYIKGCDSSINGSLPLLFIPAMKYGISILEKIADTMEPVDPLLSDLNYFFKTSEEFSVDDLPLKAGLTPLNWLSTLEKKCDPKSYGPGCALYIRKKLDSESAINLCFELLSKTVFTRENFTLIMQGIAIETCEPEVLAIFCEVKYFFSGPDKTGDWKIVNKRLEELGMNPVKDWAWIPDFSKMKLPVQGLLSELLKEYFELINDPAKLPDNSNKIPVVLTLARIRLLLSSRELNDISHPEWGKIAAFINSIHEKNNLAALYEFTLKIMGEHEELLGIFLSHSEVNESSEFIEALVTAAVKNISDKMKTHLINFADRLGWSPQKGDYGIWNKLTLYFARTKDERIIDKLIPVKGESGLGSSFEIAILNLGEKYPDKVSDSDFNGALCRLLSDGFTDYNLLSFESRCKSAIIQLAYSENEDDLKTASYGISRLIETKKNAFQISADFLIRLIKKIDSAVKRARDNSGEYWEDRNWGGYNMSPEENYAQTLSDAVRNLAKLKYSKIELDKLKKLTDSLPGVDLKKILLVESTSFSIDYKSFDLYNALGL